MLEPDKITDADLRLMGGEMTSQECRTARAFMYLMHDSLADEVERLRAEVKELKRIYVEPDLGI